MGEIKDNEKARREELGPAVPAIQRYSIGYHSDEWGVRSSTPGGIYDDAGPWVRYEDHDAALRRLHAENAALRTQQPAGTIPKAAQIEAIWGAMDCPAPAAQQSGE